MKLSIPPTVTTSPPGLPLSRRHRSKRRRILALGALALFSLTPVWSAPAQGQEKIKGGGQEAPHVRVDAVVRTFTDQTFPIIGRLVAKQSGVVSARIAGPVAQMPAEIGQRIEKGDIVAVLYSESLRWKVALKNAELTKAAAALNTAKAQLKLRELTLRRLDRLRKSSAFNPARFDDAGQEVAKAKSAAAESAAAVASARATLQLAKIDLENANVRAPYGGVVVRHHTEVGAYVRIGDPVVSMIDDRHLEIEADVPADKTGGLTPGAEIAYTFADGAERHAWVRAVLPSENPLTRTRIVRLGTAIDTTAAKTRDLVVNQSVTLRIPIGARREAVSVSKDAVLIKNGAHKVFVVVGGKAVLKTVRLGTALGERFEVLGGLIPGERVVVRGNERLQDGQSVRIEGAPG
ncbi:efflux RND transporter periplasmic adaptor subunit [Varunaivibrio sulfuroxidans]|uniref:RND family efflux transporter MFP subunit n=1 Tax=Varunaivibrio sulfuroxidans TaxID=1773489 RepID=A0A4R3J665_9PROT|nr:efflux RND transporter periplasmic adaptor subunit [Varunaivibrio sulfuroxidans]TCS60353.1 RND family efflux transporter MFP subunit [Varunaivibrio sulfuroxidans]WES30959.1 efflux RND transporter periplasmic adaptor subunit [Varunaivibrio sulfuroxidans]